LTQWLHLQPYTTKEILLHGRHLKKDGQRDSALLRDYEVDQKLQHNLQGTPAWVPDEAQPALVQGARPPQNYMS
jgi:hypothetical protein